MKSKMALMKTRVDKRTFVPGMLHDVSIAHLRLGCRAGGTGPAGPAAAGPIFLPNHTHI